VREEVGHRVTAAGRSAFRVFAPERGSVAVLLDVDRGAGGTRVPLAGSADGWWDGETTRLAHGTRYWLEVDGCRLPDPASRWQPDGVHGASAVADITPVHSPGWMGVAMADAVIYELHLGTFTADGTLAAAQARLPYLADLGINAIELLPLAAFPGERNWGYDGTFQFALQSSYGSWDDLRRFIEAAHTHGIAVLIDVVYNHFGPEGHYADAVAPYTKKADTPWGAAINFDIAWNHGIRAFFRENLRFWLEDVGFDGVRMDAVSLIFDNSPVHILREFTDIVREVGARRGVTLISIAEHLRNNRFVTARDGFGYDAQWNDDLNHAVYAKLTGERWRHYGDFGALADVAKALRSGFVLDGTRLCSYYRWFVGTDGEATEGHEHVVHIQDHDQVGNRPHGDRMIATYGRARALLGITAVMASPFVPMLWMGEEYGETAPWLFFVDFGDAALIEAVRHGRRADYAMGDHEPDDPQDRATFLKSKLQWPLADSDVGRNILDYYRTLIALKRSGALGPRRRADVRVEADEATEIVTVHAPGTLTVLNFAASPRPFVPPAGAELLLASVAPAAAGTIEGWAARIYRPETAR
jgi:maltooligosyltrehalose trehalohydrolase